MRHPGRYWRSGAAAQVSADEGTGKDIRQADQTGAAAAPTWPEAGVLTETQPARTSPRRWRRAGLLAGMGAVLAAGLAKSSERVARAADGDPLLLGRPNAATTTTELSRSNPTTLHDGLRVTNDNGAGVSGQGGSQSTSDAGAGVVGRGSGGFVPGVGNIATGPGVIGQGGNAFAISLVEGGPGVVATGGAGAAQSGRAGGTGVVATGGDSAGTGVLARGGPPVGRGTPGGVGVVATGGTRAAGVIGQGGAVGMPEVSGFPGVIARGSAAFASAVLGVTGGAGIDAQGGDGEAGATGGAAVIARGGRGGGGTLGGPGVLALGGPNSGGTPADPSPSAGVIGQGGTGANGTVGPGVAGTGGVGVWGTSTSGGVGVRGTSSDGFALDVVGKARFSTAGNGTIATRAVSATISNAAVSANSHISLTLTGDPEARPRGATDNSGQPHDDDVTALLGANQRLVTVQWIERQAGKGFVVHLTGRVLGVTPFSYLIVEP